MFKAKIDYAKHKVRKWFDPYSPLTLRDVLEDERAAIKGEPRSPRSAQPKYNEKESCAFYRTLRDEDRWALCLSGGGIRSASFALGVLQSFARTLAEPRSHERGGLVTGTPPSQRLLTQIDYLSTVSGGGYIGSWLSAWLSRNDDLLDDEENRDRYQDVIAELGRITAGITRVAALRHLRQYSNYLAPKIGLLSADLWADVVIYVRNVLLNWTVILPSLLMLCMSMRAANYWITQGVYGTSSLAQADDMAKFGLSFIFLSLTYTVANRPSRNIANGSTLAFMVGDLLPMLIGAALLGMALTSSSMVDYVNDSKSGFSWFCDNWFVVLKWMLWGSVYYLLTWCAANSYGFLTRKHKPFAESTHHSPFKDCIYYSVSGAAFALVLVAGLWLASFLLPHHADDASEYKFYLDALRVIFILPWMFLARLTAEFVFIFLANGIVDSDLDGEWLARADGYYNAVSLGWAIAVALTVIVPRWIHGLDSQQSWVQAIFGSGGALSLMVSLLLGSSSKTKAPDLVVRARRFLTLDTVAAVAAYLAGAAIVVFTSLLLIWWFESSRSCSESSCTSFSASESHLRYFWTFALLFVVWFIACCYVNINRFSLHAMYRNRLIRAFLGASKHAEDGSEVEKEDTENKFTEFDPEDNLRMRSLWFQLSARKKEGQQAPSSVSPVAALDIEDTRPVGKRWRPFHVINATLNLAATRHLDWQQRKAASFTISPLHCGYGSEELCDGGAFRPTETYGGEHGGITLGTAMATSGAAVNPNMGYHTSPGVALLMTMFNVRLGWWLGNPRKRDYVYRHMGPRFAFFPLLQEAFGKTSERHSDILLSDGGHFENLGLYEMVRRRCTLIVVSDAGCDPNFTFEDLGNAVRKIYVDFGVEIKFHGLEGLKKRPEDLHAPTGDCRQWAVADILYSKADGGGGNGLLVYIKAGICGREPIDVLQYAYTHKGFPHESTVDQFFTESQFEAYRRLGCHITDEALNRAKSALTSQGNAPGGNLPALDEVVRALRTAVG